MFLFFFCGSKFPFVFWINHIKLKIKKKTSAAGFKVRRYLSDAFLESCQTSVMEVFCENIEHLKTINQFLKETLS